ncbi:hypothetical protein GWK47_052643 [Chionoecetes opilio]|uniref:Uncharacterized protein n=1 Tax=Chionoecetes opilio TaxID=41210 RepID=A0A8J5CRN0_CHIOP|nr:hypothetical protein GWK47_052643 [Chionoecetes opilio]
MVQALPASQRLSFDGETNLTSQESRVFPSTLACAAEGLIAHYPQSNGRARGGQSSVPRVAYAATLAGNGAPVHRRRCMAIMQYHQHSPARAPKPSPAQADHRTLAARPIPVDTSLYEVSERWRGCCGARTGHCPLLWDSAASRHTNSPNLEPLTTALRTRNPKPRRGRWIAAGTVHGDSSPRQYLVAAGRQRAHAHQNRRHLPPLTCVQAHDYRDNSGCLAPPQPSQGRP